MDAKPFPNSLCHGCRHLRTTENKRGSVFFMCERAKTDERFMKYPPQPVRVCGGWEGQDKVF